MIELEARVEASQPRSRVGADLAQLELPLWRLYLGMLTVTVIENQYFSSSVPAVRNLQLEPRGLTSHDMTAPPTMSVMGVAPLTVNYAKRS